jgi:hypothetical protein
MHDAKLDEICEKRMGAELKIQAYGMKFTLGVECTLKDYMISSDGKL